MANCLPEQAGESADCGQLDTCFLHRVPGQHFYGNILCNNGSITAEGLGLLKSATLRSDDCLVCGYPKSGTTWLSEIIDLIYNDGDFVKCRRAPLYIRIPLLGDTRAQELVNNMTSPRLMKCHVPFDLLPRDVHTKQIKTVCIMRNPKDVVVSYFYFYKCLEELGCYSGTWNEFFRMFLSGRVVMGDWLDHVTQWWEQRHLPNVFIVKYEDLKKSPEKEIQEIATFLGRSLDTNTLQRIVEKTSFDQMKSNPSANFMDVRSINHKISPFMRKGRVGDWHNHFNEDENEAFHKQYTERLQKSGLLFDYEL